MTANQDQAREEIKIALEMLKKRWGFQDNFQVIRKLIESVDKTVLQLAERKVRVKDEDHDGKPDP